MFRDLSGDLLVDYEAYLKSGFHLAVMPIARVEVEWDPRIYPDNMTFYPVEMVEFSNLNVLPNDKDSTSLAEVCSSMSGIDEDSFSSHPLIVFPCAFNWNEFCGSGHRQHMEFIRTLSDYVDRRCLDFIRYCQCPLEPIDSLPGRAGTVNSNHMMAGALFYNHAAQEGRIIGGNAFTHFVIRGLGLPLESIDHSLFPKEGEVGFIVRHALSLYTALLEANSLTSRFIQALALLEFLAYPDEYKKFEEVKRVIARYIAKEQSEYRKLLDRFFELTGKKDPSTNRIIGYRTRLVHMGERLEDLIHDDETRKNLFLELQSYIKAVIDHMIMHSELSFDDYLDVREQLRPYEL